jgi:hypothetical protein
MFQITASAAINIMHMMARRAMRFIGPSLASAFPNDDLYGRD